MMIRGCSLRPKTELCELKRLFPFAGSQKRNMTDPRSSALVKLRTSLELHSPFLFARASEVLTSKIRSSVAWRRPPETAENQQAIAILESGAGAVPKKELIPPRMGPPECELLA